MSTPGISAVTSEDPPSKRPWSAVESAQQQPAGLADLRKDSCRSPNAALETQVPGTSKTPGEKFEAQVQKNSKNSENSGKSAQSSLPASLSGIEERPGRPDGRPSTAEESQPPKKIGSRPFRCEICGKRFKAEDSLRSHQREKHWNDQKLSQSSILSEMGLPSLGTKLEIVYEDDWVAIVVKPQNCPTTGKGSIARASWLLTQLAPSSQSDPLRQARPVHRLDAGTGGLLVLAKTRSALRNLSESFAQSQVQKRYRALVLGFYDCGLKGECDAPLYGKVTRTIFEAAEEPVKLTWNDVAAEFWVSTLDLWPKTGRRHQLRRHLQILDTPILGDRRYGGLPRSSEATENLTKDEENKGEGQFGQEEAPAMQQTSEEPPTNNSKVKDVDNKSEGGPVQTAEGAEASCTNNKKQEKLGAGAPSNKTEKGEEEEKVKGTLQKAETSGKNEEEVEVGEDEEGIGQEDGSDDGSVLGGSEIRMSLCLWALEITLPHPAGNLPEIHAQIPPPDLYGQIRGGSRPWLESSSTRMTD